MWSPFECGGRDSGLHPTQRPLKPLRIYLATKNLTVNDADRRCFPLKIPRGARAKRLVRYDSKGLGFRHSAATCLPACQFIRSAKMKHIRRRREASARRRTSGKIQQTQELQYDNAANMKDARFRMPHGIFLRVLLVSICCFVLFSRVSVCLQAQRLSSGSTMIRILLAR